jgi:RNA polymerase sigma factor (sigma-70 family)
MATPQKLSSNLYLIDTTGNPLDERFYAAAEELSGAFFQAFSDLGDPAVVSNAVEESARKIARHERKNGPVKDLPSYFLRTFWNITRSLVRRGYYTKYERAVSDRELEIHAGVAGRNSLDLERWVAAKEILVTLDERKRTMLILDCQGYSAKEIAKDLKTTEDNVYTTLYRARQEARRKALTK